MEWFWIAVGLGVVAFFAAGCACCGCNPIIADDFDRSNSTNLGADWTEQAGNWEINGSALRTTAANAVALHNTPITASNYAVEVEWSSGSTTSGARIYLWQDASNYIACEWTKTQSSGLGVTRYGEITIYQKTGGGAEVELCQVCPVTTTTFLRVYVNQDDGVIIASCSSVRLALPYFLNAPNPGIGSNSAAIAFVSPPDNVIGLGTTTNSSGMNFDNFAVYEESSSCAQASVCCGTAGQYPPETVTVVVDGMSSDGTAYCASCGSLDGTYTLTLQGYLPCGCVWKLEEAYPGDFGVCEVALLILQEWTNTSGDKVQTLYFKRRRISDSHNNNLVCDTGVGTPDTQAARFDLNSDVSLCSGEGEFVLDEVDAFLNTYGRCRNPVAELCRTAGWSATATVTIP